MKLALVTWAVYAAGMRLFCGVRAARWLLPWGLSCFGLVRVVAVVVLVLSGRALVHAQQDVLNAPPPAPPLTEQDEDEPPGAGATPPRDSQKGAASAKPLSNAAAGPKPAANRSKVSAAAHAEETPPSNGGSAPAAAGDGAAVSGESKTRKTGSTSTARGGSDDGEGAAGRAPASVSIGAEKPAAAGGAAVRTGSRGVDGKAATARGDASKAAAGSGAAGKAAAGSGAAVKPETSGSGGKAAAGSGAAVQPGTSASDGKAAARSGVAGGSAPPDEAEEPAGGVPPPPAVDGDFAGSGAAAAAGDEALPQDDFAAEAQEYVRPNKREYSVRIDLLNWLLLGRLSVELEMSVWKYLTLSLTPVFVVARSPIAINYAGLDEGLTQRSHGIGPLSGVSLGVGAWFWGEPFKGYVVRLEFTNYSYSYRTEDAAGLLDRVDFTERRLILFIGSHSRFGAFTFAGGFGLGYELNQQTRCGLSYDADDGVRSRSDDCKGKQQIALDRENQERANLNGPLHPVYFQARFSIGVVF